MMQLVVVRTNSLLYLLTSLLTLNKNDTSTAINNHQCLSSMRRLLTVDRGGEG